MCLSLLFNKELSVPDSTPAGTFLVTKGIVVFEKGIAVLAIATPNLIDTWATLCLIFHVIRRSSALEINIGKTQIWIINDGMRAYIQAVVQRRSPSLMSSFFHEYILYLGVHIGPDAQDVLWRQCVSGYNDAVDFLLGIDPGLVPTISLYNVLAHSKLSYVASFVAPPRDVLVLEQ